MNRWVECPCGIKSLGDEKKGWHCRCGRLLIYVKSSDQWVEQAFKGEWRKPKTYEMEELQNREKQKKGLEKWL